MTRDVRVARGVISRIRDARWLWTLSLVVVALATPATAQMAIGASAGGNRATSDITVRGTAAQTETRNAWNAGAWLYAGFGSWYGFQGGAAYSQKGPDSVVVDTTVTRISVNYVNIPVMAMATVPQQGLLKVRAFAGPSLNLKVGCSSASEGEPLLDCNQDAVKNFEFSLMFGGGLKFGRGAGGVTLDLTYDLGLTNINNTSAPINYKNRTLMLNLGFLIQFPELTPPQLRR